MKLRRLSLEDYKRGILEQNKVVLSRAITLVESQLAADQILARRLIEELLEHTGNSLRIGITGVPGVGKSTFIEAFGKILVEKGKKIAVLAIDPTSQRTGGSIMGDKTRMETLSLEPQVYIRPSPSGSSLGGVSRKTRETMLLCEAAGFDLILVETVGVGQSEVAVREMVDLFLLLMLAGAGDELQGIKRGIMEMADLLAITKADSGNEMKAKMAQAEYRNALHLFPPTESGWIPASLICSALTKQGIDKIWEKILEFEQFTTKTDWKNQNRQNQNRAWLHETIKEQLEIMFYQNPDLESLIYETEEQVAAGKRHAVKAAMELLAFYQK